MEPLLAKNPVKKLACCGLGCAALIVALIVSCVGGLGSVIYLGKTQLGPVCEQYLEHIEKNDYEAAYKLLAPAVRETQTLEQFTQSNSRIKEALGPIQSKYASGTHISSINNRTTGRLTYTAKFKNAPATVQFNLEKHEDEWSIQSVDFQSSAVDALLKCPSCGAMQARDAKFCSACGAAIPAGHPETSAEEKSQTSDSSKLPAEAAP